jgi:hypothetical protein
MYFTTSNCSPYYHVATVAVDIVALTMTCIMIYNIKSKYTAIGTPFHHHS